MTLPGVSLSGVLAWKLDLCGMEERRGGEKVKTAVVDGSLEFLCEGNSAAGGCGSQEGLAFAVCSEMGNEGGCGCFGNDPWSGRS